MTPALRAGARVYSQHSIETYLDRYIPFPGTFLEIGCWDGELISQTAYLEREKGWTGLCVDPFPVHFEHRSCRVCARAVSSNGSPRTFIRVSIDRRDGGDVSYFSGFKDSLRAHWELISKFCDYEEVQVPTITIDQLYRQYALPSHIDFLSVDTEGSELEIFESIDFSTLSFGLIVFEHNTDGYIKSRVGAILTSNGYRIIDALRCDDIYVKKALS